VLKVAQSFLMASANLTMVWVALHLAVGRLQKRTVTSQVYWRLISGFCPIRDSRGRFEQIGHFMHMAQSRINTGDCASR
jgi:hypothetical protein